MTKEETVDWVKTRLDSGKRIVIARYGDGEHDAMAGKPHFANRDLKLGDLLRVAISTKGQLVCVNRLKEKNIEANDEWVHAQKFLIKQSKSSVFGAANWVVYDYKTNCTVVHRLFAGKVLVASGHADILRERIGVDSYPTAPRDCSIHYKKYLQELCDLSKNYDSILFACGPTSKVLLARMIDKCECNLIDVGAIVNALTGIHGAYSAKKPLTWRMSWAAKEDMEKLYNRFLDKLRIERG